MSPRIPHRRRTFTVSGWFGVCLFTAPWVVGLYTLLHGLINWIGGLL